MFALKKIIASLVTIPGVFIAVLIITGIYGFKKKIGLLKLNALLGILLYLCSISFVADFLIGAIEENYSFAGGEKVDVIILLGGGIVDGVPDFSGKGIPAPDMMTRIVDTVRLYNKYRLPVIASGGGDECHQKESHVAKRFLVDLGVPGKDIIIEDKSWDTVENAMLTKEIFRKRGFKKGLLVTSAYHIRRSKFLFEITGIEVVPYSSGFLSGRSKCVKIYDFIPHPENLRKSAMAFREFIGLAFYRLKYKLLSR